MKHRILSFCFFLFMSAITAASAQKLDTANDSLATNIQTTEIQTTDTLTTNSPVAVHNDSIAEQNKKQKEEVKTFRKMPRDRKTVKFKLSPTDSAAIAYNLKFEQLSKTFQNYHYMGSDTLANPYYFYIFSRPTYYNYPMHQVIGKLADRPADSTAYQMPSLLPQQQVTPVALLNGISSALAHVYTQVPQYIANNEDAHLNETGIRKDLNKEVKPTIKLTEKIKDNPQDMDDKLDLDDWDIVVHRPNFWKFKFNFSLDMMQYYVSKNWHKGGESHNSWVTGSTIEANYDNKQKVTFENRLEMRLGFQTSKDDKEHKYLSNSDLLRLTNKLGLKASKHWYYTVMLQSWTQFHPSYKKNDKKVYSDFMSPFESVFSIGMNYKLNVKNFNLSAAVSPFASNLKYVDRKGLSTSFGVKENKHSKFDFGSNITIDYNWNIAKNISWKGRIFYFTDYDSAKMEWENTFYLKINNFLTTKVFLYPRFDDGVSKKKDSNTYFQFNETLSLGFSYSF